jgi:hypothetical protein
VPPGTISDPTKPDTDGDGLVDGAGYGGFKGRARLRHRDLAACSCVGEQMLSCGAGYRWARMF